MAAYTQIIYQIVFGTKYRRPVLDDHENRERLYLYMRSVIKNHKCHPYAINGVEDHVHILTHLHPTTPLATLVKNVKVSSSGFIKNENLFESFIGWQIGYGAFTYHFNLKKKLMQYVWNQPIHHECKTFSEEYIDLLKEQQVDFNQKYLFES